MYEQINQINFTLILDRVRVEYKNCGHNRTCLIENGKLTDGRVLNISENYINDFSKDRANGSPFSFIKKYLDLIDKETFTRFEDNFDIKTQGFRKYITSKQYKQKNTIRYCPNW